MSVPENSGNLEVGEGLSPNFAEKLDQLLGRPLTANNVNSYFDEALLGLQSLLEDLRNYHYRSGHEEGFGAPFEDRIFQQYIGCTVGDILGLISRKGEYVRRAQNLVAQAGGHDAVILPPDRQAVEISLGEGGFEQARKEDRTVEVLYRLLDSGIDITNIKITIGEIDKNMFRETSYVSLEIPGLQRLVLVCDEVGNATFVLNSSVLEDVGLQIGQILNMTKEELGELISQNKCIGTRIISHGNWSNRLMSVLTGEISTMDDVVVKQVDQRHQDSSNLLPVEISEIHPWVGFYTNPETGEHIGSINAIASRLGISYHMIKKMILSNAIKGVPIRDMSGKKRKGYSLELLNSLSFSYIEVPKVDVSGDLEGFYFDTDTNTHIGTLPSIANRLITEVSLLKKIVESAGLKPVVIRDRSGKTRSGYTLEQIAGLFQEQSKQELPMVITEGEERGQYLDLDTGVHICSIDIIAEQLQVSRGRIDKSITEAEIGSTKIVGLSGRVIDGYPLEVLREQLKDYLSLPVVDKTGEYEGFCFDPEKGLHIGTLCTISRRLGLDQVTVKKGV